MSFNSYFVKLGQCLGKACPSRCICTWLHVPAEEVVHDAGEVVRSSMELSVHTGGPPKVDVVASFDLHIFVMVLKLKKKFCKNIIIIVTNPAAIILGKKMVGLVLVSGSVHQILSWQLVILCLNYQGAIVLC